MKPLPALAPGFVLGLAAAAGAQPLTYVESSAGLTPPAWEKGRSTLAIADLNGDGHPDIISIGDHGSPNINSQLHGFSIWFGNGAGSWTSFQTGSFGYGGVAVADLNWDDKPDVAYGMHHNYSGGDLGDQLIEAALGDGTGTAWTPWDDGLATSGEDYGMFGVALADFDVDGDFDIAANSFGCCAGVHVYRNNLYSPSGAPGTWNQIFGFIGGNSTQDATAGDVNNDGYPDFAVAHQNGTVYLNTGASSFTLSDAGLPAGGLVGRRSPSLADVNADGRDDLAFVNASGGVEVWLRTPAGTWSPASSGLPAASHAAVRLHDMNTDGTIDVVAYRPTQLTVWAGNGGTSWTQVASITVPTPGDYAAMTAGDIDHNGYPDVVLVTSEGSGLNPKNRLRVFKEVSAPVDPSIRITAPTTGRHIRARSAAFIDWVSRAPGAPGTSTVRLHEASSPAGPWGQIAADLPDNGRYQHRFAGQYFSSGYFPPVSDFYLRATLTTPAGEASHVAGPFHLHDCYPDCNQSGTLNIADFACFQAAFATEGCDCNNSSTCTIADFACFQAAFAAGCP